MADAALQLMEKLFDALDRRDKQAVMALVADDGVFFDPHYPKPEMRGRAEIERGIDWGLGGVKSFGFTIVNWFPGAGGLSGCVEVDTHHVLKTGQKLNFPQVFIVESKDGKFTRLQAYEPYGPNGIGGLFLGFERLKWRFSGKLG